MNEPSTPAPSDPNVRGSQHAVDLVRHRRQVTKRQLRKQTTLRIEALASLATPPATQDPQAPAI